MASDYVRTYTDIACMKAANEAAARRAVNCLLLASGSTANSAGTTLAVGGAGVPASNPLQEIDRIQFTLGLCVASFSRQSATANVSRRSITRNPFNIPTAAECADIARAIQTARIYSVLGI